MSARRKQRIFGSALALASVTVVASVASAEAVPRHRSEPSYFRAAAANAAALAIGAGYYWVRTDLNEKDWDYPDAGTRFRKMEVTFDSNRQLTNHLRHPLGGTVY
jgi:hypothetical protein